MIPKKEFDHGMSVNEALVFMELPEQTDVNNKPLPVSFSDLIKLVKNRHGEEISFEEIVESLNGLKAKGWVKETSFYRRNIYWTNE
jgi:hypothetical protein